MAYKHQKSVNDGSMLPAKKAATRSNQDVVRSRAADQFPSVGMSLPAYGRKAGASTSPAARSLNLPPITSRPTKNKSFSKKRIIKRILLTVLVIGLLTGLWLGGKFLYNAHKLFGGGILNVLQTTKLKGEDKGRVTILLAGNSADDVGHNGGDLTDSIMLISIDTVQKKSYLLSIPRDLYVAIPGSGHQKINSAYVLGKANQFSENNYPKGGMGQLEQVIEDNLGVSVNYYALVNYNALKQAVDAVGGINYTVKSSDRRGLYDPNIDYSTNKPLVKLTNGPHLLNGQQALNLARARGDSSRAYGFVQADFDRTQHQREMLTVLKSKAVSAGVLSNPAKLSSLSDAIGGNVKTDISISEVRRLYDLTKDMTDSSIGSISLNNVGGKNYLANYQAPNGSSTLIPAAGIDDFSDIQSLLKRLSSHDPVVQEAARVVVLNATDTSGLAGLVRTNLLTKNVNVTDIGDAKANQTITSIITLPTATGKTGTLNSLKKMFGNQVTTTNPYGVLYDADFIIVVGSDQVLKQTQTQ